MHGQYSNKSEFVCKISESNHLLVDLIYDVIF